MSQPQEEKKRLGISLSFFKWENSNSRGIHSLVPKMEPTPPS